jgi:hypothetical protein
MSTRQPVSDAKLETLQREAFGYFIHEANSANGLIVDKTAPKLACEHRRYPAGARRLSGRRRARFFDAERLETGRRAWDCELSTSALLLRFLKRAAQPTASSAMLMSSQANRGLLPLADQQERCCKTELA